MNFKKTEEYRRTLTITYDWMDASSVQDEEHGCDALHVISEEWCIKTKGKYGDYLAAPVKAICNVDHQESEAEVLGLIIDNPHNTDENGLFDKVDIWPLMSGNMQELVKERIELDYARRKTLQQDAYKEDYL